MTIIITFIDTKTTSWGLTALNLRKQQGRATESLITSERERERERERENTCCWPDTCRQIV